MYSAGMVLGMLVALLQPCTSLDRGLFVGFPCVPCHHSFREDGMYNAARPPSLLSEERLVAACKPRAQRCARHAVTKLSMGENRRHAKSRPGDENEELNLLKYALDRLEQRGVRYQQLNPDEQAQLYRFARSAVATSTGGVAAKGTSYLNEANAAWALSGRWMLVLAPMEWAWVLSFSPGADVIVDVDAEKETIDYAIHFPNRWSVLQRLQWHASFSLARDADEGEGTSMQVTFQIRRLLAVVAGMLNILTMYIKR
jgi:hypothetical protein